MTLGGTIVFVIGSALFLEWLLHRGTTRKTVGTWLRRNGGSTMVRRSHVGSGKRDRMS